MTTKTNSDYSSYNEQIVDGSHVEDGSGPVWQDGQTEVVYDPAEDPALLEVPSDPAADPSVDGSDPFAVSEGDPNYDTASAEAEAGDASDPLLYGEDGGSGAADGSGTMDPTVDEGSGTMDATMDSGSGADQGCAGEVVDGVCSDGSADAGAYNQSSSGDTGAKHPGVFQDTGGCDTGGDDR